MKRKMSSSNQSQRKKIGTHNGTFHCDEALACFLLRRTDQFQEAEITRTRDSSILEQMDIVVDVGGVYDPQRFRFDHHQIGFTGTFDENHVTKLSSAGLIYKHFGREIIEKELGFGKEQTEVVYLRIYDNFIEAIDGMDNGIDCYPPEIQPKYKVHTDLSARVGGLNPWWNDTKSNPDDRFKEAVALTGKEFLDTVNYYGKSWMAAREIVVRAIESRFEVDKSGEIICLETFCPWKGYVLELEPLMGVQVPIKYVLFPDQSGPWRIQCVPKSDQGFENRKPLPWKGLRDEELTKASGIPGGIFVHINGFIGGNKNKEGALEMARKALLQPQENA